MYTWTATSGWVLTQTLAGATGSQFGNTVTVSGSLMAIWAPYYGMRWSYSSATKIIFLCDSGLIRIYS